jgi:sugar O-acyltransferase (sialic acid O-acetyltransferase NeuD family)
LKNNFLVGFSEELISLSEKTGLVLNGIIDIKKKPTYKNLNFYLESDEELKSIKIDGVVIGIDSPQKRKYLYNYYKNKNISVLSLFLNKIEDTSSIKEGAIIQENVIISCNCHIGKSVRINIGATIMHDAVLEDFVTIAPRAVVLGRVKINECVYIGENCTVLPDLEIGKNSVIGAGAVVTKNVPADTIAMGVPARFFKKQNK